MNRMLELVKNGEINCIVVKDFSRFGRNYIEAGDYIEHLFPFMGVRFISVNDGYDSQKEDISSGNVNVAFMNLVNDLYAKDISDKIKASQKIKWEKGKNIVGQPIFGYIRSETDKYKLVIDEQAAAVVRQIFDMAAKGVKTKEIAKILNDNNIPTPNKYGRIFLNRKRDWKRTGHAEFWKLSNLRRILADERYTGKLIGGKWRRIEVGNQKYCAVPKNEWVVKENVFEAIVTQEIFDKAQKQPRNYKAASKKAKKQRIIYSKIRCGSCGFALKRQPFKNPAYICETPKYKHSPDCVQERISENKIEHILLETIRRQIEIFVEYDKSRCDKEILGENKKSKLSEKIKELQKLTKDKIVLYDKYKDEKINRETYMAERETITLQIETLEKQIQALELELKKIILPEANSAEHEYIRFARITELTREMVDSLIESIIVYGVDKIEIILKYTDEFKNIS